MPSMNFDIFRLMDKKRFLQNDLKKGIFPQNFSTFADMGKKYFFKSAR